MEQVRQLKKEDVLRKLSHAVDDCFGVLTARELKSNPSLTRSIERIARILKVGL